MKKTIYVVNLKGGSKVVFFDPKYYAEFCDKHQDDLLATSIINDCENFSLTDIPELDEERESEESDEEREPDEVCDFIEVYNIAKKLISDEMKSISSKDLGDNNARKTIMERMLAQMEDIIKTKGRIGEMTEQDYNTVVNFEQALDNKVDELKMNIENRQKSIAEMLNERNIITFMKSFLIEVMYLVKNYTGYGVCDNECYGCCECYGKKTPLSEDELNSLKSREINIEKFDKMMKDIFLG